jgi:hypothetical protein
MTDLIVRDSMSAAIQGVAQQGYVAANTVNVANTTGGADYAFAWGTNANPIVIRHLMIQNNTGANISWDLDVITTAGSPILATGQTLFLDVVCAVLHLQSAANQNVNGTSSGNICIRAWQ